jgi:alpha-D-ribose 1-methylphosphonate 5-triphosphate synthase subunit PhnH
MTGQPSLHIVQGLFRTLLGAMSRPGTNRIAHIQDRQHPNALLMLTAEGLLDHEIAFDVISDHPLEWTQSLQRRTGALHTELILADFVFINGATSHGRAGLAKRGTLAYPDLGATLVYQLPPVATGQLEADRLEGVVLSGPGIQSYISPPAQCLDISEFALLKEINADYPLGVDTIILWGNTQLMAIPRSTRIEVK